MDEFYNSLKQFVDGWCQNENNKRRISDNISRSNYEIFWLKNEISKLELNLSKKPSTIRQINQYEHQILELKVKLAFDPWYGAKIQEMENEND